MYIYIYIYAHTYIDTGMIHARSIYDHFNNLCFNNSVKVDYSPIPISSVVLRFK